CEWPHASPGQPQGSRHRSTASPALTMTRSCLGSHPSSYATRFISDSYIGCRTKEKCIDIRGETFTMSGNRGCLFNSILFLIIVFVPLLGHIIATIMVLEDDHSLAGTVLWLAAIWLIPFLGAFLYLVFGQRRSHVMFGRPSYRYYQTQYQQPQRN